MKLKNNRHECFCQEYIIDFNGAQSARDAGFAKSSARITASKLLTKTNIQQRIAELLKDRSERTKITQDMVLEELKCLSFSNIKNYIKASTDGFIVFKDIDKITDDEARAIEAIKVNVKEGKIEFKLHSKTRMLELAGRHLGLFIEKFVADLNLKWELSEKYMPEKKKEKDEPK